MQPLHTSAPVTPRSQSQLSLTNCTMASAYASKNWELFKDIYVKKKDTSCVCLLCSMKKGLPRTSPVRPLGGTAPTLPDPRGAQVLETLHGTNHYTPAFFHPSASPENGNVHSCWSRVSMDCKKDFTFRKPSISEFHRCYATETNIAVHQSLWKSNSE